MTLAVSSLDILLPMSGDAAEARHLPVEDIEPAFAPELIGLMTTLMAALNAREFDHPIFDCLATRMRAYHDNTRDLIGAVGFANPPISSSTTYIAAHRALIAQDPSLRWEILRAVVVPDHAEEMECLQKTQDTTAKVWLFLRVSGLNGRLCKESISVATWRKHRCDGVAKEDGSSGWQLYGHEGFRSVSGIA